MTARSLLPTELTKVVVVGGSCAGKSTLIAAVSRDPALRQRLEPVGRVTTRPSREGDSAEGLQSTSRESFAAMVAQGEFILSWSRPLGDGTFIEYGCRPATAARLPLMSAGHGVYTNARSVRPIGALAGALIVGVSAPKAVREERFLRRSPDVMEASGRQRVAALLAHDEAQMVAHAHVIFANEADGVEAAEAAFVHLLRELVL